MNARQAAFAVLTDFYSGKGELEIIIERAFSRGFISPRDRRLAFEIAYGVLRNRTYLDFIYEQFIDKKLLNERAIRTAVQIALYQILKLDRVPDHSAVHESVELMKKGQNTQKYAGVVNGILRNFLKNRKNAVKIPETMGKVSRLALEYSHPEWLINRWDEQFGTAKTKKLLQANNSKPSLYFRWNSAGASRNAFEADIASISQTAPLGMGFNNRYYKIKDAITPSETHTFEAGACTVQSPSSGWPVAMLGCEAGDVVLDISSAPGGKTTLIAELIGREGVVIAADASPKRIPRVVENAVRMRIADRIIPVVTDGVNSAITKKFKKVLLDAPCTGTGVIQRHPDSRWLRKEKDIEQAAKLQRKLLDSAAGQVVKGGVLVYSTCSLEKEENWEQIESFLERHPEFELDSAEEYIDRKYLSIDKCLQITPQDHGLDGMFAARLKRIK